MTSGASDGDQGWKLTALDPHSGSVDGSGNSPKSVVLGGLGH
jgi:hypothetical protein